MRQHLPSDFAVGFTSQSAAQFFPSDIIPYIAVVVIFYLFSSDFARNPKELPLRVALLFYLYCAVSVMFVYTGDAVSNGAPPRVKPESSYPARTGAGRSDRAVP